MLICSFKLKSRYSSVKQKFDISIAGLQIKPAGDGITVMLTCATALGMGDVGLQWSDSR